MVHSRRGTCIENYSKSTKIAFGNPATSVSRILPIFFSPRTKRLLISKVYRKYVYAIAICLRITLEASDSADLIDRRQMSVTLAPPVFDLPRPLIRAQVSVNTTNPPAIKHRHDRAAVPLFWYFPRSLSLFLFFISRFCSSRSVFSSRFSLFLSLCLSLFFAKLPLVCVYVSNLYGSRARCWECNAE